MLLLFAALLLFLLLSLLLHVLRLLEPNGDCVARLDWIGLSVNVTRSTRRVFLALHDVG